MIINTCELTGKALDLAVAEAICLPMKSHDDVEWPDDVEWMAESSGLINHYEEYHNHSGMNRRYDKTPFSPSTNWGQCGPLIEKFHISFSGDESNYLFSACRAIVALHLGDVVAIPDGLCEAQEKAL
ncbi:phage protein NinX family protein [Serratia marcescens]|uniref:phage protein NinX family protein n=1 Tax=Serratia marcescens TaxID=615 RepID=UPI0025AA55C3|nr:phage protein NinX family protein [Serratia marcescens]MDN0031249.1 DUF2591 family protein [Serratia marcescens]